MLETLQKDIQWWRELAFQNEFAGIPMELFERRAHIDDVWLVQIHQNGLAISRTPAPVRSEPGSSLDSPFGFHVQQNLGDIHTTTNHCHYDEQIAIAVEGSRKRQHSPRGCHCQKDLGRYRYKFKFLESFYNDFGFLHGLTNYPGHSNPGWSACSPGCAPQRSTTSPGQAISARPSTKRWQRQHSYTGSSERQTRSPRPGFELTTHRIQTHEQPSGQESVRSYTEAAQDNNSRPAQRATGPARSGDDRQIDRNLPRALRYGAQRDHEGQARQKSEPISLRGTFSRHIVRDQQWRPNHQCVMVRYYRSLDTNTVSGQSSSELPPSPRKWLAGKVVLGPYLTSTSRKETVKKEKIAGNKAAANPWNLSHEGGKAQDFAGWTPTTSIEALQARDIDFVQEKFPNESKAAMSSVVTSLLEDAKTNLGCPARNMRTIARHCAAPRERSEIDFPIYCDTKATIIVVTRSLIAMGAKTSLLQAAAHGDVALVKLALERGEIVDIKDENGWTPMLFAAREGHEGVVRLLLYYDASPDIPGKTGSTPLMWAAFTGREGVVQILLEHKAKVNVQNMVGATALGLAAQNGHASVVLLLLNCGAIVDLADSDGWTPLMQAARIGHTDVIRLLLNNKAKVDAVNAQGKTALQMAAAEGNNGIVRLIQEFVAELQQCETLLADSTSIVDAAMQGDLNAIQEAIDRGDDIESQDSDGNTPLHLAVKSGYPDIVEYLIKNGAKVDSENDMKQTPLYIAAKQGSLEIVHLLIDVGAAASDRYMPTISH
ncbi:hypothetical protein ON010_g4566 [Phytophthora cinnamomi]|nr:hypothetical protein ON010_g4566 [Phytophthora cinnamomi]